ncbi:molybdopterin-dependent oxidoreductase [Methanolobus sp. ZRKC3]|uniref:molybdopterin-dependent oxidoreductase n=1 Tax=Methanolobus sp. ZRKC3 TaxID=3125786 RepID=UPI003255323D
MKEMVYQTICPGCGVGCGLYIREHDEGKISIDFMKSSPANLGKLCRFGIKLPYHYSESNSTVTGSDASMEVAIEAAALKLKDADNVAMLSVGNTSNEEHMAFTKIAETLGTAVQTGVSVYSQLPPECHPYMAGMPFADMEKAKRIALFVDPYVQYPLIVRRLLAAKNNGASIVSVGTKHLHIADENKDLKPEQYDELELDSDSLIIADVHPNSDAQQVKQLLNLAQRTGAKIHFMKPFINSAGSNRLGKAKVRKMSLSQIMEGIELGNIKTLVTLDSDPVELIPDTGAAIKTLKKLDNLIVISSRNSPVTKLADVIISTEPVYRKAGTFLSVEGMLQENSGTGVEGIDAMSLLNDKLGGDKFDYVQLHDQVIESIKDTGSKPEYSMIEVENVAHIVPEGMYELKYLYNPFMWFNQTDDNDFVLLNRNTVKKLGLKKGGMVTLSNENGTINMRYRVEEMPDSVVLSAKKLPIATGVVSTISMEGC